MSKLSDFLQSLANSIKTVKGIDSSTKLSANDFSTEIDSMSYIEDDNIKGKIDKVSLSTPVITNDSGKITATVTQQSGYINADSKSSILQFETKEAETITPTTTNKVISKDQYLIGDQTILGDENLISSNILRGKTNNPISIFGVEGGIDKIHRMNCSLEQSKVYAAQAVDVAKSYYISRKLGFASYQYSSSISKGALGTILTDSNGNCYIDCSTYLDMIVRGIDYFDSPYNGATGTTNKSNDPKVIRTLCDNSKYVWSDKFLDRQVDSEFEDIGYSSDGYYSIRRAAQLAEYFYTKGNVLYEFSSSPTSVPTGLQGGEILFWSKSNAIDSQKSRFKSISHVGIVDRTGVAFFHVTGSADSKGNTIFYSQLEAHLTDLCLIIRPNYNPIVIENTRVGMELIPKYCFDSCTIDEYNESGVNFTILKDGGFKISGSIPSSSITFYIYNKNNCITLDPGKYKLSGCPVHEAIDATSTTVVKWGLSLKTEAGENITENDIRVWDRGNGGMEFTITETTKVYIYFYISSNIGSMNNTYTVKPSLIRIS